MILAALLGAGLTASRATAQYPQVAAGGSDRSVKVFNEAGIEMFSIAAHEGAVNALCFTPDARHLISAGADGTVKIWNVDDGSQEQSLEGHTGPVLSLAVKEDGSVLASGGADGRIRLWNPRSGKLLRTIQAHTRGVRALAWSHDGKMLASGGEDRVIAVWREDGSQVAGIVGHDEPIAGLVWTRDGRSLISGAGDGFVKVWSTGDFSLAARHRMPDRSITSLVGHVDGQLLAAAGADGRIRILSVQGVSVAETVSKLLNRQVLCMAWSRDAKILVTGGPQRALEFWNTADLTVLLRVNANEGSITAVAVDPR